MRVCQQPFAHRMILHFAAHRRAFAQGKAGKPTRVSEADAQQCWGVRRVPRGTTAARAGTQAPTSTLTLTPARTQNLSPSPHPYTDPHPDLDHDAPNHGDAGLREADARGDDPHHLQAGRQQREQLLIACVSGLAVRIMK